MKKSVVLLLSYFAWTLPVHANNDLEVLINSLVKQSKGNSESIQSDTALLNRLSWQVKCWQHLEEHSKICMIRKDKVAVLRIDNAYSVSVGEAHQKGSSTEYNIDQKKAEWAYQGLYRDAEQIIEQMKKGKVMQIRYLPQNMSQTVEKSISLMGFSAALDEAEQKFAKL